jgi:hypothetical protein
MGQIPSFEAYAYFASQEFPRLLRKPNIYNRVPKP